MRARRGDWKLTLGVTAGHNFSLLPITLFPLIGGALIDSLGFDEATVGLLATAELGGIAATSIFVSGIVARLPLRAVGLFGGAVACLCHGLSMFSSSVGALLALRAAAGLGAGVAFATAYAGAATSRHPERIFAIASVIANALFAGWLVLTPRLIDAWGPGGGFGTLLAGTLIGLPLLLLLPERTAREKAAEEGRGRRFPRPVLGVLVLLAMFLLQVSAVSIWVFIERIGAAIEIPLETVGLMLAGATIIGMGGPALAALIHTRWGRILPLVIGILLEAVGVWWLPHAESHASFAFFLLLLNASFLFVLPYLMGAAAALDVRGSWAVATGGVGLIGSAVAPLLGGLAAMRFSYVGVGWLSASAGLLVLVAALSPFLALDRESRTGVARGVG